jgi:hypothetical protein
MASTQVPFRGDVENSFEYTEKSISRQETVLRFENGLGGPCLRHRRSLAGCVLLQGIKSWRMVWVVSVAREGETKNEYTI